MLKKKRCLWHLSFQSFHLSKVKWVFCGRLACFKFCFYSSCKFPFELYRKRKILNLYKMVASTNLVFHAVLFCFCISMMTIRAAALELEINPVIDDRFFFKLSFLSWASDGLLFWFKEKSEVDDKEAKQRFEVPLTCCVRAQLKRGFISQASTLGRGTARCFGVVLPVRRLWDRIGWRVSRRAKTFCPRQKACELFFSNKRFKYRN